MPNKLFVQPVFLYGCDFSAVTWEVTLGVIWIALFKGMYLSSQLPSIYSKGWSVFLLEV